MVEVGAEHADQRAWTTISSGCARRPKTHIYKAIRGGEVRVNKGRISADYRVAEGDIVRIPPLRLPDPGTPRPVPGAEFPIVFEDDALLVVVDVARRRGGPRRQRRVSFGVIGAVAGRAARRQVPRTGAPGWTAKHQAPLMVAKRSALPALHAMLREGKGDKHYLALVEGDWVNDRQHIKLGLSKWTTQSGERRVKVDPDGQSAHTIVTLKRRFGSYSLVDAELRTGRTHQIRVHLAASGFPIVGDDKYGHDEVRAHFARLGFGRMFLHAHSPTLAHPLRASP